MPDGKFHDTRRGIDLSDKIVVEGSDVCFVMLLSCVEEECDSVDVVATV